ncbi:hypothetical protein [Mucilaginibacter ginsenosidivorax]|uniref:Uncharacterized protein n=1 Tax=Mucilaginibacter ginsenosidivorax TaxID=862126 RepID=A0A5B8VX74_9SPHI|nr:hypothetical protein [Mucilaginibacter ginsenosidivorax]QEC76029.1 hypothetical protein FSB76_08745 [Mucilaginibacter ginsenosidivorax]
MKKSTNRQKLTKKRFSILTTIKAASSKRKMMITLNLLPSKTELKKVARHPVNSQPSLAPEISHEKNVFVSNLRF